MSSRRPVSPWLIAAALGALAGCAEQPVAPTAPGAAAPAPVVRPSPHDERVRQSIARHQQLAREYRQSGDLAAAAIQWQLVTLLAPGDSNARQELAATRAEIHRRVQESLTAGVAFARASDFEKAAEQYLKALALEPDNAEAAAQLRDIEKRRATRTQAGRAAQAAAASNGQRANVASTRPAATAPMMPAPDIVDAELPIELFKAGDTAGGLRDMKRYVEANPNDKAARNRMGTLVYDRGRDLEAQGQREQAYAMYEQALALRGEPGLGWNLRIGALRKTLADAYYEKGVQVAKSNIADAIKDWETSLRYDPQNAKASARLKEAKAVQERLDKPPPKK